MLFVTKIKTLMKTKIENPTHSFRETNVVFQLSSTVMR